MVFCKHLLSSVISIVCFIKLGAASVEFLLGTIYRTHGRIWWHHSKLARRHKEAGGLRFSYVFLTFSYALGGVRGYPEIA